VRLAMEPPTKPAAATWPGGRRGRREQRSSGTMRRGDGAGSSTSSSGSSDGGAARGGIFRAEGPSPEASGERVALRPWGSPFGNPHSVAIPLPQPHTLPPNSKGSPECAPLLAPAAIEEVSPCHSPERPSAGEPTGATRSARG